MLSNTEHNSEIATRLINYSSEESQKRVIDNRLIGGMYVNGLTILRHQTER